MTSQYSPLKELQDAIGKVGTNTANAPQAPAPAPAPAPVQAVPTATQGPAPVGKTPQDIDKLFRDMIHRNAATQADTENDAKFGWGYKDHVAERVGNVIDAATSGNTFLRRISGGRIKLDQLAKTSPLPDMIDNIVYKALDYTINPAALTFALLAPVAIPAAAGGVAATVLGRLAIRLAAEAGLAAVGDVAARQASKVVPEGAPDWVKFAVPLATGAVSSTVAAKQLTRSLRGLAPGVIEGLATNETRLAAQAAGLQHMPLLHDIEDIVKTFDSPQEKGRVTRWFLEHTTIDPAKAENTWAGKLYHAWIRQKPTGDAAARLVVAGALPDGLSEFKMAGQAFGNIPKAKGVHWNDVFSDPDAVAKYEFTPKQAEQYTKFMEVLGDAETFGKVYGLDIPYRDTDGKLYVPRQVRDQPIGVWEKPSDSRLNRIYEHATDASKNGVNYLGPEDTLLMHVEARYRASADAQFSGAVEKLVVAPNKAYIGTSVGKAKTAAYEAGAGSATTLERQHSAYTAYATKLKTQLEEATLTGTPERIAELTKKLDTTKLRLENDLLPKLIAARAAKAKALGDLQQNYEHFRTSDRTKLPGKMFGPSYDPDELIDVVKWKNKFIPKDQGDRLAKWFDLQRGTLIRHHEGAVVRTVRDTGDALRTASASLDWSMPFVQGLPLLAHDPKAWGEMAFHHYKAFLQPGHMNRYIADNYWDIQAMVVNGRVPAGDVEFFKSMQRGGAFSDIGNAMRLVPGGGAAATVVNKTVGTAYRAAERGYETGLLVSRVKLWKSFKAMGLSDEVAGNQVRNMTGGMDTAALGVSHNQRAVESLMFFSPKLFRSTIALTAAAARPWTEEGAQAAHTLLRLSAATAGIFALANMATGIAGGESEQQIDERLRGTLQPWNGGKFLSVRVGDNYYGAGGQVRAISQFLASSMVGATDSIGLTDELKTEDQNPLSHLRKLLVSRGSPALRAGEAGLEYATGEKLNLLPFNEIDTLPDLLGFVGKSGLPFVVQSALEAGFDPITGKFDIADVPAGFGSGAAIGGAFGLNASPITPYDRRDDLAVSEHGLHYRDLTPEQKAGLRKENTDLFEYIDQQGDQAQKAYTEDKKKIDTDTTTTLQEYNTRLTEGKYQTRKEFRNAVEGTLKARSIKQAQARISGGQDEDIAPTSYAGRVLASYYHAYELARINPKDPTSDIDYDILDSLKATLDTEIDNEVFGKPSDARAVLAQRASYTLPPELAWYGENKKVIKEADYWGAADRAFAKYAPAINNRPELANVGSYGELKAALLQLQSTGAPASVIAFTDMYTKRVDQDAGRVHDAMRRQNPALDKALWENGYTTKQLKAPVIP